MYVHGNRDLAKARDRTWEDLMNQPLDKQYMLCCMAIGDHPH